jgi:hypothetical protein
LLEGRHYLTGEAVELPANFKKFIFALDFSKVHNLLYIKNKTKQHALTWIMIS